jgi:hypothetical protein
MVTQHRESAKGRLKLRQDWPDGIDLPDRRPLVNIVSRAEDCIGFDRIGPSDNILNNTKRHERTVVQVSELCPFGERVWREVFRRGEAGAPVGSDSGQRRGGSPVVPWHPDGGIVANTAVVPA